MRADGVLRVMLNTALFKGMKVGDGEGNEPRSKQIILASLEGNRSVPLLLRVSHSCDQSLGVPCRKRMLTLLHRRGVKNRPKSYIIRSRICWNINKQLIKEIVNFFYRYHRRSINVFIVWRATGIGVGFLHWDWGVR